MTSWVFIDVMFGIPCDVQLAVRALSLGMFPIPCTTGDQKVYFYFFKGPEHYNQAVLSHSFICLPLPYMCRATTRPPRPSSTAECLCLIAHLRGEQASAASWEPRPPFEATEMD